jgi:hypothetical protein
VRLEQGLLRGVELESVEQLGRRPGEEAHETAMRLLVVHDPALELLGEDVADDPHREVCLLEDHRGRRRLLGPLLDDLVELVQIADLALEVLARRPLGGRPDDRAALPELEPLRLLAQPVALLVGQSP